MSNHAASRKHYYTVLLDRTLVCFLLVVVLNFFLPRLLPGNPVAYLTGFSEQDMTPAQVAFYEDALHLNKPLAMQFGYYLRSLLDGTLGYSYKKDAAVSALIGEKIGYTLQITVPAVLLSAGIGLKLYPRKWTRDFDPWPRSADTHLTHRGRSAAPVL